MEKGRLIEAFMIELGMKAGKHCKNAIIPAAVVPVPVIRSGGGRVEAR
jgi:hypothetical protein